MQLDFNVDIHSFDSQNFGFLDCSHLLSEVSLYGFEYEPPVPRMVQGGGYRPPLIGAPPSWLSGPIVLENGSQPCAVSRYNCQTTGPGPACELDGDRLVCKSL